MYFLAVLVHGLTISKIKKTTKIDYNKTYPKGTLLLQDYNPKDMGHVAIVWTEDKKDFQIVRYYGL